MKLDYRQVQGKIGLNYIWDKVEKLRFFLLFQLATKTLSSFVIPSFMPSKNLWIFILNIEAPSEFEHLDNKTS